MLRIVSGTVDAAEHVFMSTRNRDYHGRITPLHADALGQSLFGCNKTCMIDCSLTFEAKAAKPVRLLVTFVSRTVSELMVTFVRSGSDVS
jgi:hypothetical protein